MMGIISSAEAMNIQKAEIDHGAVVVVGNQAAQGVPIAWEGVEVTTSNNGGAFKFTTSILPADCVGKLSDGASTIEVVIENCMPALNMFLAPVPQTGQITCYNVGGTVISCAGTGQDGEGQKGVKLPTPRFTDNANGTFTDNLTGLIWLRNANCHAGTPVVWEGALQAIASLNANGTMFGNDCGDTSNNGTHQTDWRLPNIRELMSLLVIDSRLRSRMPREQGKRIVFPSWIAHSPKCTHPVSGHQRRSQATLAELGRLISR
jgi:hypothetical protein